MENAARSASAENQIQTTGHHACCRVSIKQECRKDFDGASALQGFDPIKVFKLTQLGQNEAFENNENQGRRDNAFDRHKLSAARFDNLHHKTILADLVHNPFLWIGLLLDRIQPLDKAVFINVCQNLYPVLIIALLERNLAG